MHLAILASLCPSVCPSPFDKSRTAEYINMKLGMGVFHQFVSDFKSWLKLDAMKTHVFVHGPQALTCEY
jgi:hypothetical protein